MRTRSFFIVFIAIGLAAAPQSGSKDSRDPQKRAAEAETTLTGCLDQREEVYVLIAGPDLSKVTKLKGKSFSDDNFARYIGRKVTVYGTLSVDAFNVTKIEQVAETCSA